MADMIRDDLARARAVWIEEARHDPDELTRREQSDFLAHENHGGEVIDFHALRHTCGAWLLQSGAQVKTVQTVMRHSTITLTMDTYGHLMPGQEVNAVEELGQYFDTTDEVPPVLVMTGTDRSADVLRPPLPQGAHQMR
jgi:integrase